MLVLTIKDGEKLHICDDTTIAVYTSSSNGQVKLGVTAPNEVVVLREELVEGFERVDVDEYSCT